MLSIVTVIGIGLVLSFAKIDTVSACGKLTFENGCCHSIICPSLSGNCNFFSKNCAVCEFVFDPSDDCKLIRKCSCVHCCKPEYATDCPQGCADCIDDGETECVHAFGNGCGAAKALFSGFAERMAKNTAMKAEFAMIDLNGNGFFTQEEAIRHLAASGRLSAVALAENASWFDAMDKNGNQKIEPEEFDASLGGN
ncbi:hypothetical protein GPALN_010629 [Globodera pallida]|nr:hypothetical protein GPALN_010629 [Globodera pallida]